MSGVRRVLRLLEGLCAAIAVLYATLLVLFTNYDALLVTYKNGDLTPTIMVFAVACVGWMGLRLVRSPRRPPVGLVIAGACAVGLAAVMWWWTTRPTADARHVTPTPGTGRSWHSQPPNGIPGTVLPPAPPTARP
ncbi:hypothetical protein OG426_09380 [Streptomyces canus]|uniref:hypothetical protein n=1 Tax=Streptomyces canus TaxID=58343 RepID=UPI0022579DE5|nr:hypothetical protein [Streptomyces canus]MCX4862251.1 hypothetical protein [Streptomyces canus]WSW32658.1 hypothetical protein OG426_09380 [Streptomyces canus]